MFQNSVILDNSAFFTAMGSGSGWGGVNGSTYFYHSYMINAVSFIYHRFCTMFQCNQLQLSMMFVSLKAFLAVILVPAQY